MANPHCLYCDTPRPPDEARCPECGHPWIDFTITEAVERVRPAPDPAPATAGTGDSGGPDPAVPEIQGAGRRKWVFPVAITAGAVAVYAIVFAVLLDRSGDDPDPVPPAAGVTTVPVDVTPTTLSGSATTQLPVSTTVPPSTQPPTTTTTTTTFPPIPALGDPIPLEELTLGAFALGPLGFGDADFNALGRLVATFGQPDDISAIGETDGLCPTESGRAARFGWLTVLLRDEAGTEVLVAYRLEEHEQAPTDHPTADLKTISGASIGDTTNEWNAIYSTSIVRIVEIDGSPFLLLLRSSDEQTLLWAPLSTDDPPVVVGIYSPTPCVGGPLDR